MKIVTTISSAAADSAATLQPVGERLPTGSTAIVSGESTAAGVAHPRTRESSFGLKVLDVVGDIAGDTAPRLSPRAREHVAAIIDTSMEKALSAAHSMATANAAAAHDLSTTQAEAAASASRRLIRALVVSLLGFAFVLVGSVLWFHHERLSGIEASIVASNQSRKDDQARIDARTALLETNTKLVIGHAVALSNTYNENLDINYRLLNIVVDKIGARDDVPDDLPKPSPIKVPPKLVVIAEEP